MINTINIIANLPQALSSFQPSAVVAMELSSKLNPYLESNFNRYFLKNPNPTCSISERLTVNKITGTKSFQKFIKNNQIEISENQDKIDQVAAYIHKIKYPKKMLDNLEFPYYVGGAFAAGKISVEDAANALTFHRLRIDYPHHDLKILPLLDSQGNWTKEVLKSSLLKTRMLTRVIKEHIPTSLPEEKIKKLHQFISELRPSQQLWYKFEKPLNDIAIFSEDFGLGALAKAYYVESNRKFSYQPCLGLLDQNDFGSALLNERARPGNVYYPNVSIGGKAEVDGKPVNPSQHSGHDRIHWLFMHTYSTNLVDFLRDALIEYRKLTNQPVTKDTWKIVDFVFADIHEALYAKTRDFSVSHKVNINKELNIVLNNYKPDFKEKLWGWDLVLFMRYQRAYLKSKYGISIEKIDILKGANQLAEWAEPYIKKYTVEKQIFLLQTLLEQRKFEKKDIEEFFNSPVYLPKLNVTCYTSKNLCDAYLRVITVPEIMIEKISKFFSSLFG